MQTQSIMLHTVMGYECMSGNNCFRGNYFLRRTPWSMGKRGCGVHFYYVKKYVAKLLREKITPVRNL